MTLVGSFGAGRAIEAELKRVAVRALDHRVGKELVRADPSTIQVPFDPDLARICVQYLRTPSRVLWELAMFKAERLEPLFEEVRAWMETVDAPWLKAGLKLSVDAHDVEGFAAGALQIRGTIKNALLEGSGARGEPLKFSPQDAELLFRVRQEEGGLTLSLDLAGRPLHKRGWRSKGAVAPIKETLAAQLLILARWDSRSEALVDPLAGSGTIVHEAAAASTGRATWIGGSPVCLQWPMYQPPQETPELFPGTRPFILAVEEEEMAYRALQENLHHSVLGDRIIARRADFRDVYLDDESPSGGLILTNPPYGERLSTPEAAEDLHHDLGHWWRQQGGFRLAVITGHPRPEEYFGEKPRMKKPMRNGALKVWFVVYDAYC